MLPESQNDVSLLFQAVEVGADCPIAISKYYNILFVKLQRILGQEDGTVVRFLLHEHKDLNLDAKCPGKNPEDNTTYLNQAPGQRGQAEMSKAHWPVSPAETVRPKLRETACLRKVGKEQQRKTLNVELCHTHAN